MKFSLLVMVCEDAGGLADCLASLRRLDFQRREIETVVVGSTAAAAITGNATNGAAPSSITIDIRPSLNDAIRAARGEFIALLDSDTIVHPDWLKRIDAAATDATVGCFAGEILPSENRSPVEKFLASSPFLSQRLAVSGWHFKPYAMFGNAVYRRSALRGLTNVPLDEWVGAATELAWLMIDRTDFVIRFIPDAVVYRRHRGKPQDVWTHFRNQGRSQVNWLLSQPEYFLPSVTKLENAAIEAFCELISELNSIAGAEERIAVPAMKTMMHTALLSGQLRKMIEAALPGAVIDSASIALRDRSARCCVCGAARFIPGPRGRMVGTLMPQCAECSSLERHRVLHSLLSTMDPKECSTWSSLAIGEPLHRKLRVFDKHDHASLDDLRAGKSSSVPYDVALATFAFSSAKDRSIEDVLFLATSPLRDGGVFISVDLPSIPPLRLTEHGQAASAELEHAISYHLPNVTVRSVWAIDHVTETAFILSVAAQDEEWVSGLIARFCRAQLSGGKLPGPKPSASRLPMMAPLVGATSTTDQVQRIHSSKMRP